jgi:hypothetical protein
MAKSIKQNIFNILKYGGTITTKGDILSNNPIEDKVYTKRIDINKDFTPKNTTDTLEVKSVSITCNDENFTDATINKIRFNLKNRNNSWVNIFINEAPKELIEFVYVNII